MALRDLSKVYFSGESELRAVASITLEVARGEFVAVMGASGSGKSTLMNIMGCLDRPTSGTYLLDGISIADLNRKELAILRNRKLGFIFQSFNLLSRTSAMENVELPLFYNNPMVPMRERHRRSVEALRKVGLEHRLHHRPNQLSGGQQQRIAIARALINEPEVLLADEPTGNLDSRTGLDIMELFQSLNDDGITIVMVTHEQDIAAYCKRVVIMKDGCVLSDAPNSHRRIASEERMHLQPEHQALQRAQLP